MKKNINIIFWMRALACLSIVLIHSITTTFFKLNEIDHSKIFRLIQLLLMFSTPLFVFISEFLIAKNYGVNLKENFWKSRMLHLGVPFVILNSLLAIVYGYPTDLQSYAQQWIRMMFQGGSVTYFILIIFQFFVLHKVLGPFLIKLNPIKITIYSVIFSSIFWYIRGSFKAPDIAILSWIWDREGWIIFFGWFCYFVLAFYIGVHYEKFITKIKEFKLGIILGLFIATCILIGNYVLGIDTYVESKRFDIPLYTVFVILFFFLISTYNIYVPKFILFISNYSFSIYLLHYFFVHRLGTLNIDPIKNIIFTFIITLIFSICIAYILNKFKYGKFIVGGISNFRYEIVNKDYYSTMKNTKG